MVITVTLNPALDKTLTVEALTIGQVNRASDIREDVAGKGINVSKVLKNLGVDSISTGFLGGMLEKVFIRELQKRKIETAFVTIEGKTRINMKVVDPINHLYTDINEPGPQIREEEYTEFLNKFKELCGKGDIVVLSGGVSPSIPKDVYKTLIQIAKEKGAFTILDAEGDLLEEGLKAAPNMIKPNNEEFKKLLSLESDSHEEFIAGAKKLRAQYGIENILISLGSEGALYITEKAVYSAKGLKVNVKSTVGAGDSMVAALVYGKFKEMQEEELLRFAVACGTASVSLAGTEACTLEQVNGLTEQVKIKIEERV